MMRHRQSTLLEFVGSSSPARQSRKRRMRVAEVVSDDTYSDPDGIKFEQDALKGSSSCHDSAEGGHDVSASSSQSTSFKGEVSRKSSQRPRRKRAVIMSDESDDDQRTAKKRRLVKGKRPEVLPGESDENLTAEIDQERILASRFRTRSKKTDFSRNLERLQRRRRGEATPSGSEASGGNGSESSSSYDASSQVFQGAHPSFNEVNEDGEAVVENVSSNEDDDFIIDDDNGCAIPELPTIYSMGTYQDLSHHFKVICQLFVHLAVRKRRLRRSFMEEAIKKDYFSVPLTIVRRKLSAIKDSLVTSSTWKPDFKKPLESLPHFRLETLAFSVPLCDACRIGGRVATLCGIIKGSRYDRLTFELLEENETEDNGLGEVEWNLGRFCAARAQVFHLFSHWEYALYHCLCEEVECLQEQPHPRGGQNSRVLHTETQGASLPKDAGDGDEIMDWLDARGIINLHWARMKKMMERAQNLESRKETQGDIDMS